MEEFKSIFDQVMLIVCLSALGLLAIGLAFRGASDALHRWLRCWGHDKVCATITLIGVCGAVMYGGTKGIGWKVDVDEGIIDRGCYATNDIFVAKWNYEGSVIAASWLYVDYIENGDTNAWGRVCDTNWYNLGKCRVTELEHTFNLANATNYNYFLYSDFEPTPVVHTNGVYCFYVAQPLSSSPASTNRFIAIRSYVNVKGRKIMPLPKDSIDKKKEDENE